MADVSQNDIQSLAQKLSQFTQTLTPGEQAALATVVMRGVSPSDDVSGYSIGDNADDRENFDPVIAVFGPLKVRTSTESEPGHERAQ